MTTTTRLMDIENDAYTAGAAQVEEPPGRSRALPARRQFPRQPSTSSPSPSSWTAPRATTSTTSTDTDTSTSCSTPPPSSPATPTPTSSRPSRSRARRASASAPPLRPRYGWQRSSASAFLPWTKCASPTPGTEGTLNAIRLARAYTGRHKIAKFEGGYHGNHEYVSVSVGPPLELLDPDGPTAIPEWPRPAPQRRRRRGGAALQRPGELGAHHPRACARAGLRDHGARLLQLRLPAGRQALPGGHARADA